MDAPNACNPANPNAQDQFVDAEQSPTNQVQGPAVQNQAQGPCKQQCSNWSKMCPCSLHNNRAPVQPVPTGPVVPAPQVFYQNWIGKKPEFSAKPEEDA